MSMTVIIECISWLINVTDNNDARWQPEIRSWDSLRAFRTVSLYVPVISFTYVPSKQSVPFVMSMIKELYVTES
jgi:hypothetical protein